MPFHAIIYSCRHAPAWTHDGSVILVIGDGMKTLVKVIGKSGQVSFGKEYAGRQVLIEQVRPGEWRVRTATVIPDNERWLHTADMVQSLERAFEWTRRNPPEETTLAALRRIERTNDQRARRTSRKAGSQQS